jgi:hypothetical protein
MLIQNKKKEKKMKTKKAHMYKQGNQWIVCVWDEDFHAWREWSPMQYFAARSAVGEINKAN